jgi:leucyl aminopeptidase
MTLEIEVQPGNILEAESDLAVLATFEDAPLPAEVTGLLEPNDYRGRANQTLLLYPRGALAPRRLLLVGLGNGDKASTETIRRASATAIKEAQKLQIKAVTIAVHGDLPLDQRLLRHLQKESSLATIVSGATAPVYLKSRP